jgi:hypothetical protein
LNLLNLLELFKKKPLMPPVQPNLPPANVPLDQTATPGHWLGDTSSR